MFVSPRPAASDRLLVLTAGRLERRWWFLLPPFGSVGNVGCTTGSVTSRPREILRLIAGTCTSSRLSERDNAARELASRSRDPRRLRTARLVRSSSVLGPEPAPSALKRPAGTVFVLTGCLKSSGIGARRARDIEGGTGSSCAPFTILRAETAAPVPKSSSGSGLAILGMLLRSG